MMDPSQIHVDAVQVRAFAELLSKFGQRVKDFESTLMREMARLGNSFRDQDYVKFHDAFQGSRQFLKAFVEQIDKAVPELKKDAEIITAVQNVKQNP
jgi:hypothetical protein